MHIHSELPGIDLKRKKIINPKSNKIITNSLIIFTIESKFNELWLRFHFDIEIVSLSSLIGQMF